MLSSKEFDFKNGIIFRIPLNDRSTYSGEHIDKNGIEPNIKIESEKHFNTHLIK
jgi:C-terminal processing protease CtpA/Prc